MSRIKVSEQELRSRLAGKFSDDQIEELINQYVEAATNDIPDASSIVELANKKPISNPNRVSFMLTEEQHQTLVSYFDEELPATTLVQRALAEFIKKSVQ